jgi:ABC-type branched-chain amino acid transport systems, periplasmic component
VVQDSQSDPNRASAVARQLILQNKVDMILTTSTPETTNPVAAACEKLGTPCLSTVVPWEAWYGGLGGNPAKPTTSLKYCTMFFFGLKEFQGCFVPMWQRVHTNKVVACQYPNDADGTAFREVFIPLIKESGYKPVDGGAYQDGTTDFTSMISTFKSKHCELFSNAPLPPDFNTFWKQAAQQGFKPKLATVAKVLLFPSDVTALGSLVNNVATDAWWTPNMPWKSSLTGETCQQIADQYRGGHREAVGAGAVQLQPLRGRLRGAGRLGRPARQEGGGRRPVQGEHRGPGRPAQLDLDKNPAPGVVDTPCVGVQWKPSSKWGYSMEVVDNTLMPNVPTTGTLEPTNK